RSWFVLLLDLKFVWFVLGDLQQFQLRLLHGREEQRQRKLPLRVLIGKPVSRGDAEARRNPPHLRVSA
ncbi:MAG TPA: hypothetical protein VHX14_08050, partial [Thermoanaerobaculia bacterium]|nr:hypothetical protein [Thermoanaerobaculia bacterium]